MSEDPNRIVGIRVKGQIQGCKIRSASIESSIFSGPFISLSLKIIVHTGFGFMENQTNARLPYFAGTRPLEESGIYMLDKLPEVKQMLLERGKVYEQITLKPSYVNFHGAMTYSTWYGDQHYRCTGRAMVDLKAMQNMDSSYSQYHGIGDRSNRDNVPLDSVEPEALSEDKLLMTSPFVYGYSFSAKHWGEMVVSGISEIKFREDAYNRLVLDEDTKDLMFSLVATRSTTTSDLIDGKGGGCIFLLYGPPGVGKEVSLLMKKRQCRL